MEKQAHPLFGELVYDEDCEKYEGKTTVKLQNRAAEIDFRIDCIFGMGVLEETHCETYNALMKDWDNILSDVYKSIIQYQNERWGDNDHTASFPKFKTLQDAIDNTSLFEITISIHPEEFGLFKGQEGRFVVLMFDAEWVGDDARALSVALINEKVMEVTSQEII